MSLTMYAASVPVFTQTLNMLSEILNKAEQHALARKIEPSVLLDARLFPDMFALKRQVQITCDFAKGAAARLAGREVPKYEDSEQSFADLRARIAKTIDFIGSIEASQIDGSEERAITLQILGQDTHFQGQPYLLNFVLPNFYFHASMAYAILRHNGVELGKRDFVKF